MKNTVKSLEDFFCYFRASDSYCVKLLQPKERNVAVCKKMSKKSNEYEAAQAAGLLSLKKETLSILNCRSSFIAHMGRAEKMKGGKESAHIFAHSMFRNAIRNR